MNRALRVGLVKQQRLLRWAKVAYLPADCSRLTSTSLYCLCTSSSSSSSSSSSLNLKDVFKKVDRDNVFEESEVPAAIMKKLHDKNIQYHQLPNEKEDPFWKEIRAECGLELGELSELRNIRCAAAPLSEDDPQLKAFQKSATKFRAELKDIEACENTTGIVYDQYRKVGEALAEDPRVKDIATRLKAARLANARDHEQLFFVVEGHSGVGKTQLPFALKACGLKVVHVLLTQQRDNPQPVYGVFSKVSKVLSNGIDADLPTFLDDSKKNEDPLNVSEISDSIDPLRIVQWIVHVLKLSGVDMNPNEQVISISGLRRVIQNIASLNEGEGASSLPIFIFDEVLSGMSIRRHDANVQRMRFVRNVFQALGLVAVFMGTNSSATNYVNLAAHSRGGEGPWCHLITRLPRSTDASLAVLGTQEILTRLPENGHAGLAKFLSDCSYTSTPWLIRLFTEAAREVEDVTLCEQSSHLLLDKILADMAETMFRVKGSLRIPLSGQFRLLLSGHGDLAETPSANRLVDKHLATPRCENTDLYLIRDSEEKSYLALKGAKPWESVSYFEPPSIDPFLYLTLAGGSSREHFSPAFTIKKRRVPTLQYADTIFKQEQQSSTNKSNEKALKRDGNVLEVISSVAMIIASHEGGTGGSPLKHFLPRLAWELLGDGEGNVEWQEDATIEHFLPTRLCDMLVPYLSPVNNRWPEAMSAIGGSCFGNLKRVSDSDRTDISVEGMDAGEHVAVISGEAKNHNAPVTEETLKAVLRRVPQDSDVHLVFSPKYQGDYFTKESWPQFRDSSGLKGVSLLKVSVRGDKESRRVLSVEPLLSGSAAAAEECRRCVIFLHAEEYVKVKQESM